MTLYAYDGASPFSLTAAKAHGAVLITGYIVGHPGGFDPIDKQRVRQIHALGMGFLPNWERGASYLVTASHFDGLAAGREAVTALRALGVPDDGTVACPFSWDTSIAPSKYPHCGLVADGIVEGLAGRYRFTAYGQGGLIDYFARTGRLKSGGWLSASSSFPGYNPASRNVALVQRVGSPVPGTDQNILTDPANVHAWWPAGSHYATGASMALDKDVQAQFDALKALIVKTPHDTWAYKYGDRQALSYLLDAANPAALAAAIVAKLPKGPGGSPTVADIEAAVRAVFADAATK